jgi:hypothetical protein
MYTSLFHGNNVGSSQHVGARFDESEPCSVGQSCDSNLEGRGKVCSKPTANTKPRSPVRVHVQQMHAYKHITNT